MTARSKVRDRLHRDPKAFSLNRLSLAPDKPWVRLPEFGGCLKPLFRRGVLPAWGLFAAERHQEFTGPWADPEVLDGSEEGRNSWEIKSPIAPTIRLGFLLVRIDQHIRQSMPRNLWRSNWRIRNLFNGVGRHVLDGSDRQTQITLDAGRARDPWPGQRRLESLAHERLLGPAIEELPAPQPRKAGDERASEQAVSRDPVTYPVLGKLIEASVSNVSVLPVPNRLKEKANRASGASHHGGKRRDGKAPDRIDETPEHVKDTVYSQRLIGQTIERLLTMERDEMGRGTERLLQIQQGLRMNGRSAEIRETQKTITRLLSMTNQTKETETQTKQEHHNMLKDLESKIEGMQDLNRSDLQMLRHMVQSLSEKFERQPRTLPVPRMKRWSFYGPL